MTRARPKPSDPSEIMERRRMQREDAEYFAERAQVDPSVIVRLDHRGAVVHAKRQGVFGLLLSRKSITQDHHNAIDRLWDDLAIARHEADRGPLTAGNGSTATHGPLDRALAAQDRCSLVAAHLGARCWLVLRQLIANEICAAPIPWRLIVRMATGEEDETCQAMAVRWSCRELVQAYHDIDNSAPMGRPRARLAGGV